MTCHDVDDVIMLSNVDLLLALGENQFWLRLWARHTHHPQLSQVVGYPPPATRPGLPSSVILRILPSPMYLPSITPIHPQSTTTHVIHLVRQQRPSRPLNDTVP
eukprot:scaffold54368_cov24-Cyclotella_meneghiniana.AAC.2